MINPFLFVLRRGCVTYDTTMDDAIFNAKEAVEFYLESLAVHGELILRNKLAGFFFILA
jgi:predicted RNase H-like HicB family nuclease